jgi:hypothetical protein
VDEQAMHPFLQVEHRIDCRTVDFDDLDAVEQLTDQIGSSVRQQLPPAGVQVIPLPFVVVAMTEEQARKLMTGEAFNSPDAGQGDRLALDRLTAELPSYRIMDLAAFYGPTPYDWHMPVAGEISARQAIEQTLDYYNREYLSDSGWQLRPQFFSDEFLDDDPGRSARTWRRLSQLGCVMVVDGMSLFHPDLRAKVQRSELGSSQRTSLVVVSPLSPHHIPLSVLVEEHIRHHLPRAFDRFENQFDALCEVGAGGVRQLKRWLLAALPTVVETVQGERASPGQRKAMRERVGGPSGLAGPIFKGRDPW